MSRNKHRSSVLRRSFVWLLGFLVTGKVADPPTEYELRRMPHTAVALGLSSLGAAVGAVYYLYALAPHGYLASALVWPATIGSLLLAVVVQTVAARITVWQSVREGRRRRERRRRRSDR